MFPIYKSARYFLPLFCVGLASCYKAPKFEQPSFGDILAGMKTCSKDAGAQKYDAASPVIKFEAEVSYQDTEVVACDGKRTLFKNELRKDIWKNLVIPIDAAVVEKLKVADVRFFKIQNQATCVNLTQGVREIEKDRSAVNVLMSVSDLRFEFSSLNVRDGINALHVQFFGPCERYERKDEPQLQALREGNEGFECVQAPVLAEQDVVLDLKLTTQNLPGVYESKSTCDEPKPPNG